MPKGKKPIPVIWNDDEFPSISEAARSLNVTYQTMQYRVKKGYTKDSDLHQGKKQPLCGMCHENYIYDDNHLCDDCKWSD